MARPESTAVEDWPIEKLAEHTDWSDPLADFPPPQAQGEMLMEMVTSTLEKRDRGETLDRMGRTLMVGTNNSADQHPDLLVLHRRSGGPLRTHLPGG